MIRKSLIALAVSTAVTAPAAHAVDFEISEETRFSISGTLEPSYQNFTDSTGDDVSEFADNDSTLQFDGTHAWNQNTTGFFHVEYEWQFDESNNNGVDSLDSAWIGMKGDLGTLRLGTSDPLYEDQLPELLDKFENAELDNEAEGTAGSGEGNQIRYMTPRFGGFSAGVELKVEGDAEGTVANESGTGIAVTASYEADNWGVVAGADDRGADTQENPNTGATEFVDETTAGIGGWFDIADFHFAARFASESNSGSNNDIEYTGALGSYDYGPGSVNLAVQDVSPDTGDSRTQVAANVLHDVFDNLRVFVEVGRFDRQNDVGDRSEIGAIYSF